MPTQQRAPISSLMRWGGLAGIIGGAAVALAYLLHPPTAPPEVVASPMWIVIHVLFLVSLVLGILNLVALQGRYLALGGPARGAIWCTLAITALIMIAGLDYAEIFIFPVLAVEFPEVVVRYGDGVSMPSVAFAFPASGVLFMVGYIGFGYELYRTRTVEPRATLLLMGGVLVFTVGLSGFVPMLVVKMGAVLFGAGLGWVGASLMRHAKAEVNQAATMAAV